MNNLLTLGSTSLFLNFQLVVSSVPHCLPPSMHSWTIHWCARYCSVVSSDMAISFSNHVVNLSVPHLVSSPCSPNIKSLFPTHTLGVFEHVLVKNNPLSFHDPYYSCNCTNAFSRLLSLKLCPYYFTSNSQPSIPFSPYLHCRGSTIPRLHQVNT